MLKNVLKSLVSAHRNEKGAIDIQGLMMMGIGMIFIAVGFIIYPVITAATDDILAYSYSSNATFTASYFTGLTSVTGIVPLVVLVGFVTAGVISGFLGYKVTKGEGNARLTPGGLMMLGIGIIFIAVGLIIFPVVLDGVSSVLHNGSAGLSSSYTGLSSVLGVTPLIVLTAFLAGGIVAGFFGLKVIAGGSNS